MKRNSLKKEKHAYLIHTWLDQACKGTVVNRALPSLHEGSLEITCTVLEHKLHIRKKTENAIPAISGQRYIYTGCASGRVVIYDVLTGEIVQVKIVTQFY